MPFSKETAAVNEATASAVRKASLDLLQSGDYSDVVLISKGQSYRLHKAIICSRSPHFAGMMKSGLIEATTSCITLSDDHPPMIIARLIQYLYTSDYDHTNTEYLKNLQDPPQPTESRCHIMAPAAGSASLLPSAKRSDSVSMEDKSLVTHAQMYIIGDYLMIDDLKNKAYLEFKKIVGKHAYKTTPGVIEAIKLVYDQTSGDNDRLYSLVVKVATFYRSKLLGRDDFDSILIEAPQFTLDMMKYEVKNRRHHLTSEFSLANRSECHKCKATLKCPSCGIRMFSLPHEEATPDGEITLVFQCYIPVCGAKSTEEELDRAHTCISSSKEDK